MSLQSKVRSAAWWIRHPKLYPELVRMAIFKLTGERSRKSTGEGRRWCEAVATDVDGALMQLGVPRPVGQLSEFSDEIVEARRRQDACPVRMGGGGNIELLFLLNEAVGSTRVIETGVAYGWSTLAILLSLSRRGGGKLVSVDRPYPNSTAERYVGWVVPERLRGGWTLLSYADREGLPRALRLLPQIDLCHYDSDKTVRGRRWAYPRFWKALRPGGLLVSDDIDDNEAFRDFAGLVGVSPIVVRTPQDSRDKPVKFVGILRKPE